MKNKILISFLVVTFLNFIGCYSMQSISKGKLLSQENNSKIEVQTTGNKTYVFEPNSYQIEIDSINGTGIMDYNDSYEQFKGKIPLDDITKIKRDTYSSLRTWLLIGGISLGLAILLVPVVIDASKKHVASSINIK
ncbi:MAG: hypothetical protein KJN64_15795 [Ignavibacteria bacterium]|nr:hypothetical protein [Ignavibacteria bacterium]NNJ52875.1 hypothetical protein [Ignavibacteriaceae bacterium]NNL20605.1 hypothetical protein [Ignavibacteriaceae bacterium]